MHALNKGPPGIKHTCFHINTTVQEQFDPSTRVHIRRFYFRCHICNCLEGPYSFAVS